MIIVIFILLTIGRTYFKLAKKFEKNLFTYPLIGLVTFIGGSYIFYWLLTLIFLIINSPSLRGIREMEFAFMSIPLGAIATIVLYFVLKSKWKKETKQFKETELLDNF